MPMIRDIALSFLLFFSEYHEGGISEKQKSRKTKFALAPCCLTPKSLKPVRPSAAFYAPAKSGADADGCIPEADPKVGALVAGGVCTGDGKQINCTPARGITPRSL